MEINFEQMILYPAKLSTKWESKMVKIKYLSKYTMLFEIII